MTIEAFGLAEEKPCQVEDVVPISARGLFDVANAVWFTNTGNLGNHDVGTIAYGAPIATESRSLPDAPERRLHLSILCGPIKAYGSPAELTSSSLLQGSWPIGFWYITARRSRRQAHERPVGLQRPRQLTSQIRQKTPSKTARAFRERWRGVLARFFRTFTGPGRIPRCSARRDTRPTRRADSGPERPRTWQKRRSVIVMSAPGKNRSTISSRGHAHTELAGHPPLSRRLIFRYSAVGHVSLLSATAGAPDSAF